MLFLRKPIQQSFGVALCLAQTSHGVQTSGIEEAEVAHIGQHIYACHALQQAVICQR